MSANVRGALLALIAFGILATHDVIVKTLGSSYSAFQLVFFSVLFGFPLVTLLLIRERQPGHLRPIHPWWTALRTISAVITGASAFYAFSHLPLAQVYAIVFASPLIITILSVPILGETIRIRRGAAVVVGLIGVLVVLRPGSVELGLGHLTALIAAFFGALAAIIVRKIGQDERSVVLMLYPMLANFIVMGAILPFVYEPMPIEHMGGFVVMAVMVYAGQTLIIAAYKAGEAVIVAPMQYSQILWASVYGALFFDEFPDLWTAVGALIIIGSGVYIVVREGNPDSKSKRPVLRSRTRFETGTAPRVRNLMPTMRRSRQPAE